MRHAAAAPDQGINAATLVDLATDIDVRTRLRRLRTERLAG